MNLELSKNQTLLDGKYKILELIGHGAFSHVYLALSEKYIL